MKRMTLLLAMFMMMSSQAEASAPLGFSLETPNGKGWYTIKAKPGETKKVKLIIRNFSEKSRSIELTNTDAGVASLGGYSFLQGKPSVAGPWIQLSKNRFTIPAGQSKKISFIVNVPKDAREGEHYAGITAVNRKELAKIEKQRASAKKGAQILVMSQAGIAVGIVVQGKREVSLHYDTAAMQINPSGNALLTRISNNGTKLVKHTKINMRLYKNNQLVASRKDDIGTFVTRSTLAYAVPIKQPLDKGEYTLTGTITPDGGKAIEIKDSLHVGDATVDKAEDYEQPGAQKAEPAIPTWGWVVIGLLALCIASNIVLVNVLKKRS